MLFSSFHVPSRACFSKTLFHPYQKINAQLSTKYLAMGNVYTDKGVIK